MARGGELEAEEGARGGRGRGGAATLEAKLEHRRVTRPAPAFLSTKTSTPPRASASSSTTRPVFALAMRSIPRASARTQNASPLGDRLLRLLLLGVPGYSDVVAALGEQDGGGAADATVRSGDDGDGYGRGLSAAGPS